MQPSIYMQFANYTKSVCYRQDDHFLEKIPAGPFDSAAVTMSFRESLKKVREEHPRLMRAFETGKYD